MDGLERRVLRFIRSRGLLNDGDVAVVALSGGPDSVALVLLLSALTDGGELPLELCLAHLNHALRGAEADAEEAFCREFARERRLPIETERADVRAAARRHGRSIEAAARDARYAFLGRVAQKVGAAAIATAHHADDGAETVLLRIIRGAGITGLGALAPDRPLSPLNPTVRVVRPLLELRKAELVAFLREKGQPFCADSSNLDTRYTRNRIRHVLIPALERDYPAFSVGSPCALNTSAVEASRLFEELRDARWPELCRRTGPAEVLLDCAALADAPASLRKAAVARALRLLAGQRAPPALRAEHYEKLAALPRQPVGAQVSLPRGFFARREHGLIYFARRARPLSLPERELPVPGLVELPEAGMRVSSFTLPAGAVGPREALERASDYEVYLSLDALPMPLSVRGRRPGDRFHPLGAGGSTRLKKFFIERKVPLHERDRIPLVTTHAGEIAWVVGHRIGERFKLRGTDSPVLRLKASGAEDRQSG